MFAISRQVRLGQCQFRDQWLSEQQTILPGMADGASIPVVDTCKLQAYRCSGCTPRLRQNKYLASTTRKYFFSFPDWVLNGLLKYVGIDAQQGSLAITYAATAKECGLEARKLHVGKESGKGMYRNRIWKEEPMPQTMDPEHCWKIWEYVKKELKLEEKGLLKDFDM